MIKNLIQTYLLACLIQREAEADNGQRYNWANTVQFAAKSVQKPLNVEELLQIVSDERSGNIKAIGTTHSWSDIADTDGTHISMENFKEIKVDVNMKQVTFGAGVTFTELIDALK